MLAVYGITKLANRGTVTIRYPKKSMEASKAKTNILQSKNMLRNILIAMSMYSKSNPDQPLTKDNWAQILVSSGSMESNLLISPLEDGDGVSYIYVSTPILFDARQNVNTRQIAMYEDPKHNKEGVHVGFADGHVEMLDHETFEQMLADQLAAQSSP
jgi:prepilin-type processing-associated H-X9-DG protein